MYEPTHTIEDEIDARLERYLRRGGKCNGPIDGDRRWSPVMYRTLYYWSEQGKTAYYASDHWQSTSAEQRTLFPECARCGCRALHMLHAHHLHYGIRLGRERVGVDLETLCEICHWREHPNSQGGRALLAHEAEQPTS